MATSGSRGIGATLTRDGTEIAEVIMMAELGTRESDPIDLTSHDSVDRYAEVIQGLRDMPMVAILGIQQPAQTAQWVDDFNNTTVRGYTIALPNGWNVGIRGFVVSTQNRAEIDEGILFRATIQPTEPPGAIWGYPVIGTDEQSDISALIHGSWYTCSWDGEIESITVYVNNELDPINPTYSVECAIYSTTAGNAIDSLLASTEPVNTTPDTAEWLTCPFAEPPTVVASERYYLFAWSSGASGQIYVPYDDETDRGWADSL